jgi:hypothetical protein
VWFPSAITASLLNILLNANFYPGSQRYQGGIQVARQMRQANVDWNNVYNYQKLSRVFDFYSMQWRPIVNDDQIRELRAMNKEVLLVVHMFPIEELAKNFSFEIVYEAADFEVAGLTLKFMNPATRNKVLDKFYLVRIH